MCKNWDNGCHGRYDNSKYAEMWRSCGLFENRKKQVAPSEEILEVFRTYGKCWSRVADWYSQPRPVFWEIQPESDSWEDAARAVEELKSRFPDWRFSRQESMCNNVIFPTIHALPPDYE